MDTESGYEMSLQTPEEKEAAEIALLNLLPQKSQKL